MKNQVGVWIDHRKALIVILTDEGHKTNVVISKAEKQLRRTGDSPLKGSFESLQTPEDNRRDRKFMGQLDVYYDAVIACMRNADAMMIFGPGEAKGELQARLEKDHLDDRIVSVETVGKMTARQITAKVCERFAA
ncbi:MAG: hypothetical protein JXA21_11905 [Anaerolineae bacterium]|nr:hypothetical protein [Anaerolineae bacterium]